MHDDRLLTVNKLFEHAMALLNNTVIMQILWLYHRKLQYLASHIVSPSQSQQGHLVQHASGVNAMFNRCVYHAHLTLQIGIFCTEHTL